MTLSVCVLWGTQCNEIRSVKPEKEKVSKPNVPSVVNVTVTVVESLLVPMKVRFRNALAGSVV